MSRLKLLAFFAVLAIARAQDEAPKAEADTAAVQLDAANSAKIYSNDNVNNLNNVGLTEVHENTGPVLTGPNVCTRHEE